MSPIETGEITTPPAEKSRDAELDQIRDALRGLKFGSVNVIVQDGVVVQIDRLEKRRLRGSKGNHHVAD